MNLGQLQNFRTLAELEHVAAAAEKLGIEQSSLSRSVSGLEKELGIPLFEKHGRGIQLTRYGSEFYAYVRESLEKLEEGLLRIQSMADPAKGEICIGFTYPLGPKIVPMIIRDFTAAHGNSSYTIKLIQNGTEELLTALKKGECDVAFCSFTGDEHEMEFLPLFSNSLAAVVDTGHPLSGRKTVTLEELAHYPLILNSERSASLLSLFRKKGLSPTVLSQVQGECAITGLVSVGYGISIVDRNALEDGPLSTGCSVHAIEVPELVRIHEKTYLAYPKKRWRSPAVNAFITFIKETCKLRS